MKLGDNMCGPGTATKPLIFCDNMCGPGTVTKPLIFCDNMCGPGTVTKPLIFSENFLYSILSWKGLFWIQFCQDHQVTLYMCSQTSPYWNLMIKTHLSLNTRYTLSIPQLVFLIRGKYHGARPKYTKIPFESFF